MSNEITEKRKRTISFEDNVFTNLPVDNWLFKEMAHILGALDFTIDLFHDPEMKPYTNGSNVFFRHDNPQMVICLNSLCRALYAVKTILKESVEVTDNG